MPTNRRTPNSHPRRPYSYERTGRRGQGYTRDYVNEVITGVWTFPETGVQIGDSGHKLGLLASTNLYIQSDAIIYFIADSDGNASGIFSWYGGDTGISGTHMMDLHETDGLTVFVGNIYMEGGDIHARQYSVPGRFYASRANGSYASPSAVSSGNWIGDFQFRAYDGAGFDPVGIIRAIASQNHTASVKGTDLVFYAAADGDASASEFMRYDATLDRLLNKAGATTAAAVASIATLTTSTTAPTSSAYPYGAIWGIY